MRGLSDQQVATFRDPAVPGDAGEDEDDEAHGPGVVVGAGPTLARRTRSPLPG